MEEKKDIIQFKNVSKYYNYDGGVIKAIDDISFNIKEGELVIILGDSGAGKSTALNILGGMDDATSGEVIVDNEIITSMSEKDLTDYRRKKIGFVFQFYNLIQNLTLLENVKMSSQISDKPFKPEDILIKVRLKR